jgi:hypothetical protein
VADAVSVDGQVKVTFANPDVDPSILAVDSWCAAVSSSPALWEDELGLEEVFLRVTRGGEAAYANALV